MKWSAEIFVVRAYNVVYYGLPNCFAFSLSEFKFLSKMEQNAA